MTIPAAHNAGFFWSGTNKIINYKGDRKFKTLSP